MEFTIDIVIIILLAIVIVVWIAKDKIKTREIVILTNELIKEAKKQKGHAADMKEQLIKTTQMLDSGILRESELMEMNDAYRRLSVLLYDYIWHETYDTEHELMTFKGGTLKQAMENNAFANAYNNIIELHAEHYEG